MKNKGKLPEADTKKPDKQSAIGQKEEVRRNPDEHIDQDFPGFPDQPSAEKTINPQTEEDKENASLGSADAFEETESKEVLRAELENDDDKDKKAKNDQTHY
jgi:hypothetical protein